jgi:RND family efflux transporter MFP subunit
MTKDFPMNKDLDRDALRPFSAATGRSFVARHKIGLGIAAVSLIIFALGARAVFGPSSAPPAPSPNANAALTVTTGVPERAVWPSTIEASGPIAPWQEASISAQVGGYQLIDVRVNVGDQVRKGDILAKFDPALLHAEEAQLAANFAQAEANHKRALELKANGFISEQNILQLETQMKVTAAQLQAKRLQLRYTDIIAPDDGAISARAATLGAVVGVGQELFKLVRQNRLEWRAEVSAKQIGEIKPGQTAELTLPDGSAVTATVRQIAPTLSQDSRLGVIYADLAEETTARAGMYTTGRIVVDEHSALVVPSEAVVLRDGRNYVLTLGPGNTAKVATQAVEIGQRRSDKIEIRGGLSEDTRIIVRGAGFLNDGDTVRVVAAPSSERP